MALPYRSYAPNPKVCRKAVSLWLGMMRKPVFNQLGADKEAHDAGSVMREAWGQIMTDKITSDTDESQLEAFSEEFYRILTTEYPFQYLPEEAFYDKQMKRALKEDTVNWLRDSRWERSPGTDYDPNFTLWMAGNKAGLPRQQFPIKTRMGISENHISLRAGYGAGSVYYFPMGDGRWLVTDQCCHAEDEWEPSPALIEQLIQRALASPDDFTFEQDDTQ